MTTKLPKERTTYLRRHRGGAETPRDHMYVLTLDKLDLTAALERLLTISKKELDKYDNAQAYKNNKPGRLLSNRPDPLTELGTQINEVLRLRGVDSHAMVSNLDYAKSILLGFKSIVAVEPEFTGNDYRTTLELITGDRYVGLASWSAALSCWTAFIPVYLKFLEQKREDWTRKYKAEKRAEIAVDQEPRLSDRALRYRAFQEKKNARKKEI